MTPLQSAHKATVYVIDDDDLILWTLRELLQSISVEVKTCSTAKEFLNTYRPSPCECVISDVRMPEISGLQMQKTLTSAGLPPPIIFITSHSELSAAVEAMKSGAFDFVEKPVNGHVLLEKVQAALLHSRTIHAARLTDAECQARIALLTPKERCIVNGVVKGKSSREISQEMGISARTVENHRSRIMDKLHVTSTVELVKLFL